MQTLVVFDIGDTGLRNRVARFCRDAGMERTQFSAYMGACSEEVRATLIARIEASVAGHAAGEDDDQRSQKLFIQVFPICAADFARAKVIVRGDTSTVDPVTVPEVLVL